MMFKPIDDFEFLTLKDHSRFEGGDGVATREQRNEALDKKMGELATDHAFILAYKDTHVDVFFRGKEVVGKTAVPSDLEKIVAQFSMPQGYMLISAEAERSARSFGYFGTIVHTHGNVRFYYLDVGKKLVLRATVPTKRVEWERSRHTPKHERELIPLVVDARAVDEKSWCFHLATGGIYQLSLVPGGPRRFPMHSVNVVVRSALNAPLFPPTPFRIRRKYHIRLPRFSDFLTLVWRF